jgi:sulfotransferase 6B1
MWFYILVLFVHGACLNSFNCITLIFKDSILQISRGVFMRQLLVFLILFLIPFQAAFTQKNTTPRVDNIVCITIPKCGTHLIMKALVLTGEKGFGFNYNHGFKSWRNHISFFKRVNANPPPHHYKGIYYYAQGNPLSTRIANALQRAHDQRLFTDHWPHTQEAATYFNERTQANFFILRDPRAMLVSMAFMLKDGRHDGQHAQVDDLIWDFIDGRQQNFIQWGVEINELYPLLWEKGVVDFYKLFLPWMHEPTIRFEDLVGSKGGGSDEVQDTILREMFKHASIVLSPEKFENLKKKLFGDSTTFREGSIDGWKKHFTPAMKDAFKKVPGANQLLIDLGYEKDDNW